MKKLLLIVLAIGIVFTGYSQVATVDKALLNTPVEREYTPPIKDVTNFNQGVNPTVRAYSTTPTETIIGYSFYDLWSNTLVGNRLTMHDDGTMAAVWIRGMETPPNFPDRGTGYNYYDGSAWGPAPDARLEDIRCGWPSYDAWGPNGEINVAHNGSAGLEITSRENKGTGAWTQENYLGPAGLENDPTWPRIATSGDNNEYIHLLYNSYVEWEGQLQALLYSRSDDGGETWDPRDIIPDGTGEDDYTEIGADSYILATRGDVVVILVANAWYDMFMLKSEDNGDNWEKTVIWEHPYPFFEWEATIADTFFCVDNSAHCAIGPDGKVHVVFGINRVMHLELGTTYNYFPYVDGIGYWNEDMPTFSNDLSALAPPQYDYPTSEMIEDYNYIGYMQDYNGNGTLDLVDDIMSYRELGPSTMPSITVDDDNNVFVVFASTTEDFDNFDFNFKKLWARAWVPGGGWGPFYHITEPIIHIFDESIYPLLAPQSDGDIHLIYQADGTPGLALDEDHDYQENRIIHAAISKTEPLLVTGIDDRELITEDNVSQNFPNPFSTNTMITVALENPANLSLEVTNLMGQQVYQVERGEVSDGTYYFQINAEDLGTGIYFYTVKANQSSVTKKMIVQ
jgi:hypothetical protein